MADNPQKIKKRYKVKCIGDGNSIETAYRAEWISHPELKGVPLNYLEQTPDYFIIEIDVDDTKHAKLEKLKGVDREYKG